MGRLLITLLFVCYLTLHGAQAAPACGCQNVTITPSQQSCLLSHLLQVISTLVNNHQANCPEFPIVCVPPCCNQNSASANPLSCIPLPLPCGCKNTDPPKCIPLPPPCSCITSNPPPCIPLPPPCYPEPLPCATLPPCVPLPPCLTWPPPCETTTTEKPVTTEPPTTTEESTTTTEESTSTTEEPTSTTVMSTTEEPTSTTEEPTSTTEEPTSTTEEPTSTTEEPTSTTEEPTSTTEEPTSTTEEPSTTTELPSTTEIPTTTSDPIRPLLRAVQKTAIHDDFVDEPEDPTEKPLMTDPQKDTALGAGAMKRDCPETTTQKCVPIEDFSICAPNVGEATTKNKGCVIPVVKPCGCGPIDDNQPQTWFIPVINFKGAPCLTGEQLREYLYNFFCSPNCACKKNVDT